LEVNRDVPKPEGPKMPAFQFYLTKYTVRNSGDYQGCIEIKFDTDRFEKEHLKNVPDAVKYDLITNGIWV